MNKPLKLIVQIVVFLFFFCIFGLPGFVKDKTDDLEKDKKLREEILAVYQSKGKEGLQDFLKKKINDISNKFIVDLAESGYQERNGELFKISRLIAEEKKDDKILANVYFRMGEYFRLIADYKNADDYLKKALHLFVKLDDQIKMAYLYMEQGLTLFSKTENDIKTFELYDKALSLFKINKYFRGLGDVYNAKARLYLDSWDDYENAIKMYDKALEFYKKSKLWQREGWIYENKGTVYHKYGDYDSAIRMYNNALDSYKKAGVFLEPGEVYIKKANIYYHEKDDNTQALEMYNKALPLCEKSGNIIGLGNVYWGKGAIYKIDKKYLSALEMYDKALTYFEQIKSAIDQGKIYLNKGDVYSRLSDYSKAITMVTRALTFFEEGQDIKMQINAYTSLAEIYLEMGDNVDRAIKQYIKILGLYKPDNHSKRAFIKRKIGDLYFKTDQYSKAIEMYDNAFKLYEKAGNLRLQIHMYNLKGTVYRRIGENANALDAYKAALSLCDQMQKCSTRGNLYMYIGDIYCTMGDYYKAMKMFEKALAFFKETNDPLGERDVYAYIERIYMSISKTDIKTYKGFHKVYEFLKSAQKEFNKKMGIPGSENGLENSYYNNFLLAEKALKNLEERPTPRSKGQAYLDWTFAIYGLLYTGHKSSPKYEEILKMYGEAEKYFKKAGYNHGLVLVHMGIANTHSFFRKFDNAVDHYDTALKIAEETGNLLDQGLVLYGKMSNYEKAGDYERACQQCDEMLKLHRVVKNFPSQTEYETLFYKAQFLKKLGRKDKALKCFEESIAKMEKVRQQTGFPHLKKRLMQRVYEKYRETVIFMLDNKHDADGFNYVESMKARLFLDQLSEGMVKLEKGISPEHLQKRNEFVSKLSLLSKEINKAARGENEKTLKKLKDRHEKTGNEYEDLMVKIRLENPLYASVQYPKPIPLRDLQKDVLKEGELLLQFFVSSKRLYVFLVSKRNLEVVSLDITEESIMKLANRYLLSTKRKYKEKLDEYGKKLYQAIFKPLELSIKGKDNLIIIPDGQLATIPFESLVINDEPPGKPVYLLEKYKIKYIQSASVLSTLRKYYKRISKIKQFIGFGDPVYDYENFKKGSPEQGSTEPEKGDEIKEIHRGKYDREGGVLDRLQGSGQEVQAIAGLFKKDNQKAVIHLRDTATEEMAKSPDLKDYDYIHFSCHGILGDGFQSLVLSQVPKSKEDGYLTMNEIMNCDYNAKLVVLSACETGKGKMDRGEGVTGLTRAVMYAGTPAVVASLWNVSDIGTKELMVQFYKNILEKGMSKEDALREAKLSLLRGGKYSSPYYWSSFVMYGE